MNTREMKNIILIIPFHSVLFTIQQSERNFFSLKVTIFVYVLSSDW
jgi:hypothetical protein